MIYLFGDMHGAGNIPRYDNERFPDGKLLTKDDYVIILGDFGVPWYSERSEDYKFELSSLKWLSDRPWTTLFIDGNHENFDNLYSFPEEEKFGGKVGKLADSIYHLKRGYIYNLEGKSFFTFGGALSLDKANRITNISWWPEEFPNREEIGRALDNLESVDYKVDYVLTHTCPLVACKDLLRQHSLSYFEVHDSAADFLDHIEKRIKCKRWFFGHFHLDYDSSDLRLKYHTLMYRYIKLNTETNDVEYGEVKNLYY